MTEEYKLNYLSIWLLWIVFMTVFVVADSWLGAADRTGLILALLMAFTCIGRLKKAE